MLKRLMSDLMKYKQMNTQCFLRRMGFPAVLALVPFFLTSCLRDTAPKPEASLPPISCEGRNKMGCLLNGAMFLPDGINAFSLEYHHRKGKYQGSLTLKAKKNWANEVVEFNLVDIVLDTGDYSLSSNDVKLGHSRYFSNFPIEYYCLEGMYGKLHVSGIDTTNRIICGTFEFDAVSNKDEKDTIRIRDGRFDAKYWY